MYQWLVVALLKMVQVQHHAADLKVQVMSARLIFALDHAQVDVMV